MLNIYCEYIKLFAVKTNRVYENMILNQTQQQFKPIASTKLRLKWFYQSANWFEESSGLVHSNILQNNKTQNALKDL